MDYLRVTFGIERFNRTFMELKQVLFAERGKIESFNRTFMELKYNAVLGESCDTGF